MIKLIHVLCGAVTIDQEIFAMEIDTVLHSGSEDPVSPYMGVFVSRAGMRKQRYLEILNAEGRKQYFRFLTELGIVSVVFMDSGSLEVKEFGIPTRRDLEVSMSNMRRDWARVGVVHDDSWANDMVDFFDTLSPNNKINAARRLSENAFLFKRFEEVKRRSTRPAGAGYLNYQRTPHQEMDAVYKQLFQKGRLRGNDPQQFDFTQVEWKESTVIQDVPLKLMVPQDQAGAILNFVLNDPGALEKIGLIRLGKLRIIVTYLLNKYTKQYSDYFSFVFGSFGHKPSVQLQGNVLDDILQVQEQRRKALLLYDNFRFPFPDSINPWFDIYVYDPEQRVDNRPRRSFKNIQSAMQSYSMVVRVFKRQPKWLFIGVLQDVILCKRHHRCRGYVTKGGSVMGITEHKHECELALTLEHELGHVADYKFHRHLQDGLTGIDRRHFSSELRNCLTLFASIFLPDATVHFTTYSDISVLAYLATLLFAFRSNSDPQRLKLEAARSKLNRDDWNLLRALAQLSKKDKTLDRLVLTGEDIPLFTSGYASQQANEEAAELIRQIANPRIRAESSFAFHSNEIKREKIQLALDVLSSREPGLGETNYEAALRAIEVNRWKREKAQVSVKNDKPTVVVYVSKGPSHDGAFLSANARVQAANVAGAPVSYIFLLQSEHIEIQVVQRIKNPVDCRFNVIFFGIDATELESAWDDLYSALVASRTDYYGQFAATSEEVYNLALRAENVNVNSFCIEINIP